MRCDGGVWPAVLVYLACGVVLTCLACSVAPEERPDVEWRRYAADAASSKYAPLDDVDAGNFERLETAWVWESAAERWKRDLAARIAGGWKPPYAVNERLHLGDNQGTPLMIDGVLYGITSIGQVYALDAATGAERWVHDPESYRAATRVFDFQIPKHRGVTYWAEGDDRRILVPTPDAWLIALDADTGEPIASFGEDGRVDLMAGLRRSVRRRLGTYYQSSPGALVGDVLVVGSSMRDRPLLRNDTPGDVRGYDVRTGALRWTFHTVPVAGDAETESWEDEAWRSAGAANAWGPMSVDEESGAVYVTTSAPTNDLYGGHRLGDNRHSNSLLCLDGATGALRWSRQLIRHGIWDYDLSAPPNLVDLDVDGRRVRAVAQITKHGFVFVFDRETGEPLFPIEERAVPASDVPGERVAATQPVPTRPPPFESQGAFESELIDLTPQLRREALAIFRRHRAGPLFTPPSLEGTISLPGASGGANWHGAGVDPETGTLFVPSIKMATVNKVRPGTERGVDFDYETHSTIPRYVPKGVWTGNGLPLMKPPWSRISAIALGPGTMLWQVPNGNGPRGNKRLKGLDLPRLGAGQHACVLVTRSLLMAGEGTGRGHPRRGAPLLHAYDKSTGERVGSVPLPGQASGCPMSYRRDGVQYVVVPVGGRAPSALVALALRSRDS